MLRERDHPGLRDLDHFTVGPYDLGSFAPMTRRRHAAAIWRSSLLSLALSRSHTAIGLVGQGAADTKPRTRGQS